MRSYIILETKKDPVSFRKRKGKKRNGHFCMKKKQERADKYMLVSGALPIFAS